jgi:serine/threonine-protein kinase RsbW
VTNDVDLRGEFFVTVTPLATSATGFVMQDVLLDLAIPSRLEAMGTVQARLDAALRRLGLDDEACHRIGLATHEAVANAIVHGNRRDPGRPVEVQLACDGEDLVVRVADRGAGFDPAGVADPLLPENLLRSGGRGLLLMRALMDEVGHGPGATGGTVAVLRRRLAGDPPHPGSDH